MRTLVIVSLVTVFAIAIAPSASAQPWPPASFTPAAPTAADQIRASFTIPGLCSALPPTTSVTDDTIRTTVVFTGCVVGPPPFNTTIQAVFGPVPAGTYTYEIYFSEAGFPPERRSQQPLVVVPAPQPIPSLSAFGIVVLSLLLAATAIAVIPRVWSGP